MYYERSVKVPQDHAVCNLIGKYRTLKDALESMRDNTRLQLQPYIGPSGFLVGRGGATAVEEDYRFEVLAVSDAANASFD